MTPLAACPSCSRHVRIDEARCPFCAQSLEGVFSNRPPPLKAVGRLSRAALLALGASAAAAGTTIACSSDDPEESIVALYGAPPVPADASDDDTGTPAALYGAPAMPDGGGDQ